MNTLEDLRETIKALEAGAKKLMEQKHPDSSFFNARENLQRGKFIAYGHVITEIDRILNKTPSIDFTNVRQEGSKTDLGIITELLNKTK